MYNIYMCIYIIISNQMIDYEVHQEEEELSFGQPAEQLFFPGERCCDAISHARACLP
jgi:hypothetical protein